MFEKLFLIGMAWVSLAAQAVTLCQGKTGSVLSPAVPNPGAVYFQFNTKLKSGTKYALTAAELPTVSYYNITAYLNGVQIGNLNDFEIQTAPGANFFPTPGFASAATMGTSSAYRVTIGEGVSGTNTIRLPAGAAGQQLEIFLRYYPPLGKVVYPTITELDSNGVPVDCAAHEPAYFSPGGLSGLPVTTMSSGELAFYKAGGAGLYPDTNGYYFARPEPSTITLVAFPAPKYPPCIGVGCRLDRTGAPAYTSLQLASTTTTQSLGGLSDREMRIASDGFVYLAFAPSAVGDGLARQGYQVLVAPLGMDIFAVYRQKLPPANDVDNIARVPFLPPQPENPAGCDAANFVAAAPVATVCPVTALGALSTCVRSAKQTLQQLIAQHRAIRTGAASAGPCR